MSGGFLRTAAQDRARKTDPLRKPPKLAGESLLRNRRGEVADKTVPDSYCRRVQCIVRRRSVSKVIDSFRFRRRTCADVVPRKSGTPDQSQIPALLLSEIAWRGCQLAGSLQV